MSEVWVRSNCRPLFTAITFPLTGIILGGALVFGLIGNPESPWPRILGVVQLLLGGVCAGFLAWIFLRPRLAYDERCLLAYLRAGAPIRVPIEIVEGFLLGRAAAFVPGKTSSKAETAALVIRLAESAPEWSHVEIHPQLGRWCDGYVTIRGTWCEPLSVDFVNRLNARLAEVQRPAGQGAAT